MAAPGAHAPAKPAGLCRPGEISIFACNIKGHEVALCGSNPFSATAGYLQYRSRRDGRIDLAYPARPGPAGRSFLFASDSHAGGGDYYIHFAIAGFDYYLFNISESWPVDKAGHRRHFDMNGVAVRQAGRLVSQRSCPDPGDLASNIDYRAYTNLAREPFDETVIRIPTR